MLYIVATPIGNLKDITLRALEILKSVDLILAEDTRQTRKLLTYYQIKTPLQSYHQHSGLQKIDYVLDLLRRGKNLALVADAGTPGIADPGNKLIEYLINSTNDVIPVSRCHSREACPRLRSRGGNPREGFLTGIHDNGSPTKSGMTSMIEIMPIPGPSALTAALSISGLPCDKFLFLGFPPAKKKRQKFFEQVINSKHTVVFYESCHRILRTLEDLGVILNGVSGSERSEESLEQAMKSGSSQRSFVSSRPPQDDDISRQLVVCRELTKKFETIYRGSCEEIAEQLKKENHEPRGEFVVIVGKCH